MTHAQALAGSTLVALSLAALVVVGTHGKAWPHEAPAGWSYPFSCCSGYDCREVPDTDIVEGAQGYELRKTGELIIMTDKRIKESPDGRFHWCSVAGADDSRTICLFVPPRSF